MTFVKGHVQIRTPAQRAATAIKRHETELEKQKYSSATPKAKIGEIRKLKTIIEKRTAKLSDKERRRLGYLAHQNNKGGKHDEFLNWIGSPTGKTKKTKKSSLSKLSKERIMREADRKTRKKMHSNLSAPKRKSR
jgi:hypothetical protein